MIPTAEDTEDTEKPKGYNMGMDDDAHRRFHALRGICRDLFESFGGFEAFLRMEREEFLRDSEEREKPTEELVRESH